jgi:hypothetical protein
MQFYWGYPYSQCFGDPRDAYFTGDARTPSVLVTRGCIFRWGSSPLSLFLFLWYAFRKSEPVSSDSAGAPPEKKLLLESPLSSAVQTLTSSVADIKTVTPEPSAVRKIIKLKRPGRTAPPVV